MSTAAYCDSCGKMEKKKSFVKVQIPAIWDDDVYDFNYSACKGPKVRPFDGEVCSSCLHKIHDVIGS